MAAGVAECDVDHGPNAGHKDNFLHGQAKIG